MSNKSLMNKLKNIKLLITDVDGVLTDAGFYYNSDGLYLKKFNTRDGMGVTLLRTLGLKVAITTGENSPIVASRAEKLRVTDLYLGIQEKVKALDELCEKYDLKPEEVAYIGDDLNDIEIIRKAGVGFAVGDAFPDVKEAADYITEAPGGGGALREVANLIIAAKGRKPLEVWQEAVDNLMIPTKPE